MDWEDSIAPDIGSPPLSRGANEAVPPNYYNDPLPSLQAREMDNNVHEMDVDPSDYLVIVPDTNIWIGYSELLKTILNTDFDKVSYPTIIIPWMVMQELDVLGKQGRGNNEGRSNQYSARKSIMFIHELLDSKHPRVRGQKASDAARAQDQFKAENADDRILQCALQCVQNPRHNLVVFLTNDRNLFSKAIVESSDETRRKLLICNTSETIQKIKSKVELEFGGRDLLLQPPVRRNYQDIEITQPAQAQPVTRTPTPTATSSTRYQMSPANVKSSKKVLTPIRWSPKRKASLTHTSVELSATSSLYAKKSLTVDRKPLKRNRESTNSPLLVRPIPKKSQPSSPAFSIRSKRIPSGSQADLNSSKTPSVRVNIPSKCETFKEVLGFLQHLFSCVFEFKMKEDFGERLWTRSLLHQPPWTLKTALECLIHHHFAVFSYVFGIRSKPQIESLLSLYKDYKTKREEVSSQTSQLEEDIIELALTLIMLAKTKGGGIDKKLSLDDCEKVLADYLKEHK